MSDYDKADLHRDEIAELQERIDILEQQHDGVLMAFQTAERLGNQARSDLARVTAERDKAIAEIGEQARQRGLVEAERDRLREACEKIIAMSDAAQPDNWGPGFRGYHAALRDFGHLLKAALAKKEEANE